MNITRREAIRNCFIISVGAAIIPSCLQENSKPTIALKHLDIDGKQERIISELSETIIPRTDTPGAKDTYTHLFVLKMVDDCQTKEEQQKFMSGLKEFEKLAQNKYDKSFVECSQGQRDELVGSIINKKAPPNNTTINAGINGSKKDDTDDVTAFVKNMKRLTLQGYMTSQYYLTKVQPYKLVPGKFEGCILVTSLDPKERSI
ncbi:MAG: gluconate 2-dehydrogenase subunit 3 family protein [Segetibacter sp.]|nr:gluconate 2-dehydrogenase subunit 3 family protein [Segetibacter sp.]